ncbi:MAG: hypothetical protein M3040_11270 [Bacteroidota bacterium]|nr:hypothetical protein [Bacteroidota bacterium]
MSTQTGLNTLPSSGLYPVSNGQKIILLQTTSNKNNDDKRRVPAMVFDFIKNGKAPAALQCYGDGLLGRNRCIRWIDSRIDTTTRLVLAALMTTILLLKTSE